MEIELLDIPEVLLVKPEVFQDERGWFQEDISIAKLKEVGIVFAIAQENCAYSKIKHVLRGLHFQNAPYAQAKLVRCTKGKILDIAVDVRKDSPTYRRYVAVELSARNHRQFYIPKGFAHGTLNLEEDTEIHYYVDMMYMPEYDRSVRWDDPELSIDWKGIQPVLSPKDSAAPFLRDSDCNL